MVVELNQVLEELLDRVKKQPLIALAAIALLLIFVFMVFGAGSSGQGTLSVVVQDEDGKRLENAAVTLFLDGNALEKRTNEFGVAEFSIPLDRNIAVLGVFDGYYERRKELNPLGSSRETFLELIEIPVKEKKSYYLLHNGSVVQQKATAFYKCSTGTKLEKEQEIIQSGFGTTEKPFGCGTLTVSVFSEGFVERNSVSLKEDLTSIELQEVPPVFGELRIKVKDYNGDTVTGVLAKLFRANSSLKAGKTTLNGLAEFKELAVGKYYFLFEDQTRRFPDQKSREFDVKEGENKEEFTLQRNMAGSLKIRAVDKETKELLENSRIALSDLSGKDFADRISATGEELVDLLFAGELLIKISHQEYLSETKRVLATSGLNEIEVEMEKITEENSGRIRITTKTGTEFVENAEIKIFDSETNFIYPLSEKLLTDKNGEAAIRGIRPGKYYLKAYKMSAEGTSETKQTSLRETTEFEIEMEFGEAVIHLEAADEIGQKIREAQVLFYSSQGTLLGEQVLDEQGSIIFRTPANKRIYFALKKQGFLDYYSAIYELNPNNPIFLKAEMKTLTAKTKPEIEFLGLYKSVSSETEMHSIESGKSYYAKFKATIPDQYEQTSFHLRLGKKDSVFKESYAIAWISTANALTEKGATWNPAKGETIDYKNLTQGNGKWAKATKNIKGKRVEEYWAKIALSKSALPGTELSINYRLELKHRTEYLRLPTDSVLGNSKENSSKQNLYASSYKKSYLIGKAAECVQGFCYCNQKLYSKEKDLMQFDEPFEIELFGNNELHFSIENSTGNTINPSLELKGLEGIEINSVSLLTGEHNEIKKTNLETNEPEAIELGELGTKKSIHGIIGFKSKKEGQKQLSIKLIESNSQVFTKTVLLKTVTGNLLNITATPEELIPYSKNAVQVEVKDKDGFAVEGAKVFAYKVNEQEKELVHETITDELGKATAIISNLAPSQKVLINVEKHRHSGQETELHALNSIVLFDPEEITTRVEQTGTTQTIEEVQASNLIECDLRIKEAGISGNLKRLVLEQEMETFIKILEGEKIGANSFRQFNVLKTIIAPGINLSTPKEVQGKAWMIFENKEKAIRHLEEIPFRAGVGILQADLSGCLVIDLEDEVWKESTSNEDIQKEFTLINRCKSGSAELDLKDLSAQITWNGKTIGDVIIDLREEGTTLPQQAILYQGLTETLFSTMKPFKTYYGKITFKPKIISEEKSRFSIKLKAKIRTDAGPQTVQANKSFRAELMNVDFRDCIIATFQGKQTGKLRSTLPSTPLVLDTAACGEIKLPLRVCGENQKCTTVEDTTAGLNLNLWQTTGNSKTETITVARKIIAGTYELPIEAYFKGKWIQATKAKIEVQPDMSDYFFMENYELKFFEDGGTFEETLFNRKFLEKISILANRCHWAEASGRFAGEEMNYFAIIRDSTAVNFGNPNIGPVEGGDDGLRDLGFPIMAASLPFMAAWGPWGLAVGFILSVFGFGDDPCDHDDTHTLYDFPINLAGSPNRQVQADAKTAKILGHENKVLAEWNLTGKTDIIGYNENAMTRQPYAGQSAENTYQEIGLTFTDIGLGEGETFDALLELTATEHIHGSATHTGGSIICWGNNFWNYWINPGTCSSNTYDTEYAQKMHVRISPKPELEPLPEITDERKQCFNSGIEGRTGSKAIPNIKLKWNWNEIQWNSCDTKNPESFYCDATQFSIATFKKMKILQDWFKQNNYYLGCPQDNTTPEEEETSSYSRTTTVYSQLGITKVDAYLDALPNDFAITAVVQNNTANPIRAEAVFLLYDLETNQLLDSQSKTFVVNTGQDSQYSVNMRFEGLQPGGYYAKIQLTAEDITATDWLWRIPTIVITPPVESDCAEPMITGRAAGEIHIFKFLDNYENTKWTQEIPDREALRNILEFEAKLIRDKYSEDFKHDFAEYYTEKNFADTPPFFNFTENEKFKVFFENENTFEFKREYNENDYSLPAPGIYDARLVMGFRKTWNFFTETGEPNANIDVTFNFKKEPSPGSPFYEIPFNGMIGITEDGLDRIGYGAFFIDNGESIPINSEIGYSTVAGKSQGLGAELNAAKILPKSEIEFNEINSNLAKKGNILEIKSITGNEKEMTFNSITATPVAMEFEHEKTEQEFHAFYSAIKAGNKEDAGENFLEWTAMGSCYDFTGNPLNAMFNETSDRRAESNDGLNDYRKVYAIEWNRAVREGKVYLKAIVYTPRDTEYYLTALNETGLQFITPNDKGKNIALKGITGMQYNRWGSSAQDKINSINELFELVKQEKVCVANRARETRYFWDAEKLMNVSGTIESINALEERIDSAQECMK